MKFSLLLKVHWQNSNFFTEKGFLFRYILEFGFIEYRLNWAMIGCIQIEIVINYKNER